MLVAVIGLVVGLVVGGLGAGGGVLAVPALVYLVGQTAQDATATSVVVVRATRLRRANFANRYRGDGGWAATGRSAR